MIDFLILLETLITTKFSEDMIGLLLSLKELPFDCSPQNLIRLWLTRPENKDISKFILKYLGRPNMKSAVELLPLSKIEDLVGGNDISHLLDQSAGNLRKVIVKRLNDLNGKESLIPELILVRSDDLAIKFFQVNIAAIKAARDECVGKWRKGDGPNLL